MKKLAFMFVAVVAISFASCGNKTQATEENDTIATDPIEVCDTAACDTAAADTVVAE